MGEEIHKQENVCMLLTLILLESKMVSLCHQYRARPACTSARSDQALYCWPTLSSHLYNPKMIMNYGNFQKKGRLIIHWVKIYCNIRLY